MQKRTKRAAEKKELGIDEQLMMTAARGTNGDIVEKK